MLATDLIMEVRASRAISAEQVARLERMLFELGAPSREQLDLVFLIDSYVERRTANWADLMTRAAMSALVIVPSEPSAAAKAA